MNYNHSAPPAQQPGKLYKDKKEFPNMLDTLIISLISGITAGSIYILVAWSITLLLGVLGIPDFSQAGLILVGGYLVISLSYFFSPITAIFLVCFICANFGIISERVVFSKLMDKSLLSMMVAALGLFTLYQGVCFIVYGPLPMKLRIFEGIFYLSGHAFRHSQLIIFLLDIIIGIFLYLLIKKSRIGLDIRAISQDSKTAKIVGINPQRIYLLVFGISSAFSALAGILYTIQYSINPFTSFILILKAFVIVILGGVGKLHGAIAGAFLLGLTESLLGSFISHSLQSILVYILLIVIIIIKPTGLFGGRK